MYIYILCIYLEKERERVSSQGQLAVMVKNKEKKNCSLPDVILILQFMYDYAGSPHRECSAQRLYLELCNISAVLVAVCLGYFTCYCQTLG